jgi:hypothetical protein
VVLSRADNVIINEDLNLNKTDHIKRTSVVKSSEKYYYRYGNQKKPNVPPDQNEIEKLRNELKSQEIILNGFQKENEQLGKSLYGNIITEIFRLYERSAI